jgi:uncharacterized protein YhaN
MKLEALDLIAYGPFTRQHFGFPSAFTIVFGLNEAGKTSALRAITDGLYGIPLQTSDDFIHPYRDLRIGLALSDGAHRLEFIRRKANVQSLRGLDDATAVEDSELERFLKGLSRADFETMFGISHERLVQGGREIAAGKGEVGQILFAAAAGLIGLQTTLDRLEQQAGELYAPRASSKSIHLKLRQIKEAASELRQKQVGVAVFEKNREALDDVAGRLAACDTGIEEARRESERLKRIQKALSTIAGRKLALAEWRELAGVPALDSEYSARLERAERDLDAANLAVRESELEMARSVEAAGALVVPGDLLAADDRVRRLYEQKSAVEKSKQDCIRRETDLAQSHRTIGKQVEMLKPGLSLEQAASLEPGVVVRKHVQELAALAPQLEAQQRSLEGALVSARSKVVDYDRGLTETPAPPDAAPLSRLINRARRELDFAKARQLRTDADVNEGKLRAALAALPLWTGSGEDLEILQVPGPEAIEEMRAAFQASENAERAAREGLAQADKSLNEARTERDAVIAAHSVPTLDELRRARSVRELGWAAIQRIWRDAVTDAPEGREFLERIGADDLTSGYDDAVKQADGVADRMREAAEKVERVAMLDVQIAAWEERRKEASLRLEGVRTEGEGVRARWLESWSGAQLTPGSPAAMLNWLRKREAAMQFVAKLRELRTQLAEWEIQESGTASELRGLLAVFGGVEDANDAAGMLDRAEQALGLSEAVANRRRTLESDRQAQAREIDRIERDLSELEKSRTEWNTNWDAALRQAGLDPGTSPAAAEAYLSAVLEIQTGLQAARELDTRIRKMHADAAAFEGEVGSLVESLDPELKRFAPEQAIVQLHQALASAKENLKLLQREETTKKAWEKKQKKAAGDAERASAEIARLCREAGVDDPPSARAVCERVNRRRELEKRLTGFQEGLSMVCGAKTIEEFIVEAEAVDPDSVPGLLDAIERRSSELRTEREALDIRRRGLEAEALSFESADGAAIAQHISGLSGALSADVEEYVRLKTASVVLRKAIEQYRERNQGPVLEHAGRLFSAMTRSSFGGLRVESVEGKSILVGTRTDGRTVEVSGMSDGTCDQLYLALRIASLEHYFGSHAPVPFIVDDVLLSFDDERAAAALSLLNDLSAKTQIVFFTHHRHLAELAKRATEAAVVEIG